MGNGGSASTASHMASDLNKGANRTDAPRFSAIALTDNIPLMMAWANDSSYDDVFIEQLRNHLEKGDVVIGISGSGNSLNVLKAIGYANSSGATTIGLAGFDGGELAKMAKISYTVPSHCMQQVEDVHLILEHMLSMILRDSPDCGVQ
jgi:D-sedoheptulose 7-phosphate isomerase